MADEDGYEYVDPPVYQNCEWFKTKYHKKSENFWIVFLSGI